MKRFLFLGLLLIHLPAGAVEKGATRRAVLAELGEPSGSMLRDGKEILIFKTGTITLQTGTVIKVSLSQANTQQTDDRMVRARESREAKLAELEKQKLLYPEDHVVRVGCAYSKTENWEILPDFLRPAQGGSGYDIYIPPGYHESDSRYYKCLFLESPALWNSVRERAQKEKWMIVILRDVAGQQIGKTLNGNFLAAFDDATTRFRIAKGQIFIIGKVPSAIFSALRPVAGIILQNPDFSGFEKTGFTLDFLRKNPELRAYVLLSNSNRDNVIYQGQFIVARIPKYHIEVYQDEAGALPPALAASAIEWMKNEYALP